jgi:hypothetical protein
MDKMAQLKTLRTLTRLAASLDEKGEHNKSDDITILLKAIAKNPGLLKKAGWFNDRQKDLSNIWGGIKGVGNLAYHTSPVGGGIDAAKGLYNGVQSATNTAIDMGQNAYNQFKASNNYDSVIAQALAQHQSGQNGWTYLNGAIASWPENMKQDIKQKFMQSTGQYIA